jgi:Bacterial TniB protein
MARLAQKPKRKDVHVHPAAVPSAIPLYAHNLWADRWISYPRAEVILHRMAELLELPVRVRMQNLLIHGASGAGKSMLIQKFVRDHPADSDADRPWSPVLSIQMPPMPTVRSFFAEILRSLDFPVIRGSRLSDLEHNAIRQLEKLRPKILAIDEVHNLLACTPREQRAALNVLKFLSNEMRASIIAAGTTEALIVMQTDPQIASRFESAALPSWTMSEDLRSFVAGFFRQLAIDPKDIVNREAALAYILELTSGVTGRIVELIRQSAQVTIRCLRTEVTMEHLQHAGQHFAADLTSVRPYAN